MKINYTLDKDKKITAWASFPLNEKLPIIEVEDPYSIKLGFDKVVKGKLVIDTTYNDYIEREKKIDKINKEINLLKDNLQETDYRLYKYLEGYYTEEEYLPYKLQRQEWREKINILEKELEIL